MNVRTLYRLDEFGRRDRFIELTWDGAEVEIATGKVGARGRTQTKIFESAVERDDFIAKRLAKARNEGYVESSEEVAAVDSGSDARIVSLRAKYTAPCFIPGRKDRDDAVDTSKIGGSPFLPDNASWPICGHCRQPLAFRVQLSRNDVPESMKWPFRSDFLQVFICDSQPIDQDRTWCVSTGKDNAILHVAQTSGTTPLREALTRELMLLRRRRYLLNTAKQLREGGDEAGARAKEEEASVDEVDPRVWNVPNSRTEVPHYRILTPAQSIDAWSEATDVAQLDPDDAELLEERTGLRTVRGTKLGGFAVLQDRETPSCNRCETPMRLVMQLAESNWGGPTWLFACATCQQAELVQT